LSLAESFSINDTQLAEIFSWKKINNKQYSVSIIDKQLFDRLMERFPLHKVTNRQQASIAGNSHNKRVSGSLLSFLAYQQTFPQLIVFAKDGSYELPPSKQSQHHNLLIIENLENFLSLIKNPDELNQWLDDEWPCDIVYAQGNAIGNHLHQQFFCQYDKIRCLLDIDLGGFEIFKNINKLTVATSCTYVLSQYYLEKYIQFGNPVSQQQRSELEQGNYPQALEKVIKTVLEYNQFAEQEILLC